MDIIVKPVITEKSVKDSDKGIYTFLVHMDSNKPQIKKAVEDIFKVTVKKVHVNIVKGMRIRMTRKGKSESDLTYKKARVQLAKGQKIELLEEKSK